MNKQNLIKSHQSSINPTIIAKTLSEYSKPENISTALNPCKNCFSSSLCLVKGLDIDTLKQTVRMSNVLREGEHLYRQEDEFHSVFIIKGGAVKSYSYNIKGEEVGVTFYLKGEMIGLDGLFDEHYKSSVVALEDTYICEFPRKALEQLLRSQPSVLNNFMELQSQQLVQSQANTILQTQKCAEDRLATFLLNLSDRYSRLKLSPTSFRLPMSRQDIALCLGLAHETISRLFNVFQKKGWVSVSGREITLTNLPGMENRVNG